MTQMNNRQLAFGRPGIEPRWTGSAKEAVGTAYSAASRVWYTLSLGVLNEIYYPTLDRPQTRDLQYLITDGATFFHDERRHLTSTLECLSHHALGFRVTNTDPEGRYRIVKDIIADPHQDSVLIHTTLEADGPLLSRLKLYALLAPHIEVGGWQNNGDVREVAGRKVLTAHKKGTWMALAATVPFAKCSCGYVGSSDGWTDVSTHRTMEWEFDSAVDGNIALIGELDVSKGYTFTLGLAFGDSSHSAVTTLFQSLDPPFARQRARFVEQWERACRRLLPLGEVAGDGGTLAHHSQSLLLAHEDKRYQGAMIASLSIPWGDAKGDDDIGGYHLVWTRDMCNSATGLLAAGNTETPLRALVYLACTQQVDGGFPQNFWINGEPHWRGIQLDEVSFPIILAWRLHVAGVLRSFDPYPMVLRAARYLIKEGPATQQERWEENSGYSPSTLAANIAALTCAALFARARGDAATAEFIQEYADFLECHVESWTVTTQGALGPGIGRHFIRIHPVAVGDPHADEDPNHGVLAIRNRPPGAQAEFPAKNIVDAGFLELVRYGIRKPGDPLIEDSLRVVDAVLKIDTPFGPCWRRYNHDGYGQRDDGGPYLGAGTGRAWPLLTGERGHYELAAGRDVRPFIAAMEAFANSTGLLPEQIWDEADRPDVYMSSGRPTGSAMPLMWAHAEYMKLLRSVRDGQVFDFISAVGDRYLTRRGCKPLEVWKFTRQPRTVMPAMTLRVQAPGAFLLHWTANGWESVQDTRSTATALGIEFVDIPIALEQRAPVQFTFYWIDTSRWEGRDFQVTVQRPGA
ncbi:MAG: glucan 1,4-alpha-glucosidase [Candidatus Rokubacteria bacterium]|nr:glucan 1,4-alpha-glucosidase [Candidatus Rokubacteria bacterium]